MGRNDPQMRIRLPDDAKAFVERRADQDACSQNSVIVRAVREMKLRAERHADQSETARLEDLRREDLATTEARASE